MPRAVSDVGEATTRVVQITGTTIAVCVAVAVAGWAVGMWPRWRETRRARPEPVVWVGTALVSFALLVVAVGAAVVVGAFVGSALGLAVVDGPRLR